MKHNLCLYQFHNNFNEITSLKLKIMNKVSHLRHLRDNSMKHFKHLSKLISYREKVLEILIQKCFK